LGLVGRGKNFNERVLKAQLHRGVLQVLVKWAGLPVGESTWEPVEDFKTAFPEDELIVDGGSDVMVGKVFHLRNKTQGG
jgi:hypothetical protein